MQRYQAIAAMSENRVIGKGNDIPWHLPEDFKWFKKKTTGHVLVMGRKTFVSIGKLLPGRTTVVVSRAPFSYPGAEVISDLRELDSLAERFRGQEIFICGGGQIYRQMLPRCSDLFLTLVKRTVDGDVFFPPFETDFTLVEEIQDGADFKILHYKNTYFSNDGNTPAAGAK